MIKSSHILFILLLSIIFISPNANAGPSGTFGGVSTGPSATGGSGSGGCDWSQYLNVLSDQEQLPQNQCGDSPSEECKARQYQVVRDDPNPLNSGSRDASWGRFQFVPGTWSQYVSPHPESRSCVRYHSIADLPGSTGATKRAPNLPFAISQTCWPVQDWAAIEFSRSNLEYAQGNATCQQILAMPHPSIVGTHVGPGHPELSCGGSMSGLLSALHNGGKDCDKILRAGKTGSHLRSRMCKAANIPIPGDCNPSGPPAVGTIVPPNEGDVQPAPTETPVMESFTPLANPLKAYWVRSLQFMTESFVLTMMQQAQAIGQFFDAKHQLEVQLQMQERTALAHKKYHPSEELCKIGTFVRNLGNSERRAILTQTAIMQSAMNRALKSGDTQSFKTGSDEDTIQAAYLGLFCDSSDNSGENDLLCSATIPVAQKNADIDYTKTISAPLTINIDLLNPTETIEEATVFTFMNHLFMHNNFPWVSMESTKLSRFVEPYLDMRSVTALRSVAQNSLAYIISEKSAGTNDPSDPQNAASVAPFLKSMMSEMGISDDEVEEMLGENPSYYAQMEMLTRQIYYHPEFVSNLYDKPANVKRMAAAMTAIKSMQNWQISEALKRREMLFSVLLEIKLREKQNDLETQDIPELSNNPAPEPMSDSPTGY